MDVMVIQHIISTLLVMLSSLFLLLLVLFYNLHKNCFRNKRKLVFYVFLLSSIYYLLIIFKDNSTKIHIDILDTIENTNRYNGFYDSISLFIVTLVGGILGGIFYYSTKFVKQYNASQKEW